MTQYQTATLKFDSADQLAAFWIKWRAYAYRSSAAFHGYPPAAAVAMSYALQDFHKQLATRDCLPGLTTYGWFDKDVRLYLPSGYELPRRVT